MSGVEVDYGDLVAASARLDRVAGSLTDLGWQLGRQAVDGDVLAAGLLCPGELAAVEAAVAAATAAPGGSVPLALELEVVGGVVRTAVAAYAEVDRRLAQLEQTAGAVLAAGEAAVDRVVDGVVDGAEELADFLSGTAQDLLAQGLEAASQYLFDHPWLLEAITRALPGGVQVLLMDAALTLGGPLGLAALLVAAGGHWPSSDYTEAVLGLQTLLQRFGLLEDTGPIPIGDPVTGPERRIGDNPVADLLLMERDLGYGTPVDGHQTPGVAVTPVVGPDGVTRWIVDIPGTEEWAPHRGENPFDLTSNVQLMTQRTAQVEAAVLAAMRRAGIPEGGEVMLVGHSQGGIIAAAIAADAEQPFEIRSVLTAGSPIAHADIPPDVATLSLEHTQDVVPMLDAADNPDRPGWTTIRHDLDQAQVGGDNAIAAAHDITNYAETAAALQTQGLLDDWTQANADFLPSVTGPTVTVPVGGRESG